MLRDIKCPICKEQLGNVHKKNTSHTIEAHVYEKHPEVWKEINDTVKKINALHHRISNLGKKIYDKYGILVGYNYQEPPKK